jgi:hypothetical protein
MRRSRLSVNPLWPAPCGRMVKSETVKHYELQSKIIYGLFAIAMPLALVVFGAFWIYLAFAQSGPGWFGVLWFALVLYGCYQSLWMPYRIEVTESGLIRFIGIRTTTVLTNDVVSVRSVGGGFLELRHRGGKLRLLQQFTGFHEFLSELKQANPSVEVRGC